MSRHSPESHPTQSQEGEATCTLAARAPGASGGDDNRSHLVRLDVLRGVAIALVFLYHYQDQILDLGALHYNGLVLDVAGARSVWVYILYPLTFGWAGVSLFFVISGFVIHLSFLRGRTFRLGRFYTRRFWRIYPPYLLSLCVWAALEHRDKLHPFTRGQFLSHLLLIHNFRLPWIFAIVPAFWSLAVEAQFYLIYPLLLMLRERVGIRRVLWFTLILSLTSRLLGGLFLIEWQGPLNPVVLRSIPVVWFDWTIGAYVAEQFQAGRRAFPVPRYTGPLLLLAVVLSPLYKPADLLSYSLAACLAALFIDGYLWRRNPLSRVETALVPLGLCSYSFYLWHQPLMTYLVSALNRRGVPHSLGVDLSLTITLVFASTFAFSWLLYRSVEQWGVVAGKYLVLRRNRQLEHRASTI